MGYDNAGDFFKSIVTNQGDTPLVNYNFMLRVEGLIDVPCKAVRVFQKENEFEYIQEGGLNDYVHMRRKPITKPFTFQVERYVGIEMLDPMSNGTEFMLPLILFVNRTPIKDGSAIAPTNFSRVYTFTGAVVMSKEFGELQADKSGLLVETTTIGYREMVCVDNPAFDSSTISKWEFNTGGTTAGYRKLVDHFGFNQSKNTRAKYTSGEKTKEELLELAKYRHWTPDPFGTGVYKHMSNYQGRMEKVKENLKEEEEKFYRNRELDRSSKKEDNLKLANERAWHFKEDGQRGSYKSIKKYNPQTKETTNDYLGNDKRNRAEDWSVPAKIPGTAQAGDVRYDVWDIKNAGHRKEPLHARVLTGQRSLQKSIELGNSTRWTFAEDGKKGLYKPIGTNYKGNEKFHKAEDWSTPPKQEGAAQAGDVRYDLWDINNEGHRKAPIHAQVPKGQRSKEDGEKAGNNDRWEFSEGGEPGKYAPIGENYKGNDKTHRAKDWSDAKSSNIDYAESRAWGFSSDGKKGTYKPIGNDYNGNGKKNRADDWSTPAKQEGAAQAGDVRYDQWFINNENHRKEPIHARIPSGQTTKAENESNARKYPSTQSAAKRKGNNPEREPRRYPPTKSAAQPPKGSGQTPRKYPDTRSAKQPPKGKGQTARKYPPTKSAAVNEKGGGKKSPRLYPPTKSAAKVDKQVKSKAQNEASARKYPPTRSAAQVSQFLNK